MTILATSRTAASRPTTNAYGLAGVLASTLAFIFMACDATPLPGIPDGSVPSSGGSGGSGGGGGFGDPGTGGSRSDGGPRPGVDGGGACVIAGTSYEDGAAGIPAPDGCNHCNCVHGELACTLIACPIPGKICGGIAGLACAKGEYCNFAPGARCGATDASGTCASIPQACTQEFAPVCGCDGKTYGNACSAAAASISVASDGACAPPPGTCFVGKVAYPDGTPNIPASDGCNTCSCVGGVLACTKRACPAPKACGARAGATCGTTEYCAYEEGALCGAADAEAVCKPRPEICSAIYAPVCGCDGKTYSSACVAAAAGTGVVHAGACAPKICGGLAGFACGPTEYCAYSEGQLCGAADASATCQKRPDGCTLDVNQVCGCDGKTYLNACGAAMIGVGVRSKGRCAG